MFQAQDRQKKLELELAELKNKVWEYFVSVCLLHFNANNTFKLLFDGRKNSLIK